MSTHLQSINIIIIIMPSGSFHRHARRLPGKNRETNKALVLTLFWEKKIGRAEEICTPYIAILDFLPPLLLSLDLTALSSRPCFLVAVLKPSSAGLPDDVVT